MINETQVTVISEMDQELAKENVTKKVIADLKEKYMGLTIKGPEDAQGYTIVKRARLECRDLRILATNIAKKGREHANAISKAWIAKEKEVVGEISEVEDYLQSEQDKIDNIEKIALEKRTALRKQQLADVEYHGDYTDVFSCTDEVFNLILGSATKEFQELTVQRNEQARVKAEEEQRLEKQRIEQEERMKEIERKEQEQINKEKEQKAEQERIESEKKSIEDEKIRAEEDKQRAIEIEEAKEKARLQAIEDEKEKIRIKDLEDKEAERKLQEAEEKRLQALPDMEKMKSYAHALSSVVAPILSTQEAKNTLTGALLKLQDVVDMLNK